jgi:glutathione S-transferase
MTLHIYGDSRSGNCLKVKWTAEKLGLPYDWTEVDTLGGATRKADFLRLNPAGQVPMAVLDDGRVLAQSNAIILHLADGSHLIPKDPYDRAKMFEWLFWEQYSHEPYIAVARFHRFLLGKGPDEIEARIMTRGGEALDRLELQLKATPFLVRGALTLADVALVAYTRVADEGGFELDRYPAIRAWISRVEAALRIAA